ncbi:hypothetical protein [Marinimicrobium sp. ABcell2]|uniref:hypothetical protein n=1 Tax=Marinimicrobium sp. ABcell2 TaxID=3069751 RepID=UPI0027B68501|nr:hypothetical protein [Marinimicrobium sp. ABcell2]MDQ2077544.1 hypothetical protein [Marinimicrobium sp. ABcell2]
MNAVVEQLKQLPQFRRIEPSDAKAWLEHVIQRDPKRVLWLLGRLGAGFGGSEVGTLVLDAMGRPGVFGSAAELVNEKLMRVMPSPSNHYMRKGIILEEAVQRATLRLYGGEVDESVLQSFREPPNEGLFGLGGNPDFPWLRRDGVRALVDIKVPGAGEDKLTGENKQLHYGIQLHVYNLLNTAYGNEPFDRLMNIHLELPPAITDAYMERLSKGGRAELPAVVDEMVQLLKYDRPGMRLHMNEHPINPEIDFNGQMRPLNDVIQEVAAVNWQAVLDGNVPELHRRADVSMTDEQREALAECERELTELQAVSKATEGLMSQVQERMRAITDHLTETGNLQQTPHQNIKRSRVLNQDDALQLLQRYNIDPEPLRAERKSLGVNAYDTLAMVDYLKDKEVDISPFIRPAALDTNRVIEALEDHGENPARVLRYETSVNLSRKKVTGELVNRLTERFTPAIASTLQTHRASEQQAETEQPSAEKDEAQARSTAPALTR